MPEKTRVMESLGWSGPTGASRDRAGASRPAPGADAPDLPGWAAAIAARVEFFARGRARARRQRRALRWTLKALRAHPEGPDAALATLCDAMLRLVAAGLDARPDLAPFRPAVLRLCALARAELAGTKDDRPLLAALEAEQARDHGLPWWLAALPGRVVFLAAMPPEDQADAATMAVNDLAALGADLPLAALAAAARAGALPARRSAMPPA
jgi:hypothetical protein